MRRGPKTTVDYAGALRAFLAIYAAFFAMTGGYNARP